MAKNIYIIEGLDRLGKTTLIKNIKNALGYYEVIHFGKPELLDAYFNARYEGEEQILRQKYLYQYNTFLNSMKLVSSNSRLIFDRSWLGEAVYSNLYRGYDGNYVFDLEKEYNLYRKDYIRLILLTEDFKHSKHFKDDGLSFDPMKRQEEQQMFIDAFGKSEICDKIIINVTDINTGVFRNERDILMEAIS